MTLLTLLCITTNMYGQSRLKLKKGIVTNSLAVPHSKGMFSVYLPKSFDLNTSWPILFGFDSTGNMNGLTDLFKKSAEEQGYIVAVSNYGGQLSIEDRSKYISLFIEHIINLFPIRNKGMYVFGVGEDAFLNTSLPLLYKHFNGVIAIGDSYDYFRNITTRKDFSFIGMIGDKNFRYEDFIGLDKYLKRKRLYSKVYAYEGNEELPIKEIIDHALPHFTLHAMVKGNIPKDSSWIANQYQKKFKEVILLKEESKYIQAYDALIRMMNTYSTFLDVDMLKEEKKKIKSIIEFKKEKRLRTKYLNQELFLKQIFLLSLGEDVDLKQYDNLGWWQYRMKELDKVTKNNEKYSSDMVFRLRGFLKNVLSDYKKFTIKQKGELDKKIFLNILSTIIDKRDYESYQEIISLCVMDQDNETALFYLEKMLQNGYKQIEPLYEIEGTLALRISKEYNRIIKKHLGTSKYFSFN